MKKLHLGCGQVYLDGYVNVDYPRTEHTVQASLVADEYCNLVELEYPAASIAEIRLHHVFEHFSRPVALAMLCRWTDWLPLGGTLRIETPDLMAAAKALASPFVSYKKKQQISRHLFGSHEAAWAAHWDGWYAEKFRRVLGKLGYVDIRCTCSRWNALHNVDVTAQRGSQLFSFEEYQKIVSEILHESLIASENDTIADSEKVMHKVWMDEWRMAYLRPNNEN